MTMSLDSFYETLAELGLIWSLDEYHGIRCELGDCPIIAVHRATFGTEDEDWGNEQWDAAARELGLELADAELLLDAADSHRGLGRPELLTACGL